MELTAEKINALLLGCRNNDRRAQEDFYHWLKDFAVHICFKYTNQKEEMEDLVSEGFIRVFKNIHLYNEQLYGSSISSFKGWFKKVLVNCCIDWYRKKHILTIKNNDLHSLDIKDNSENALDLLSYTEILESIRNLPPSYKVVFILFVIEGMTHEEIAEHLHINIGTSKSNLFKARALLKKMLKSKESTNYA